ncbi:hypothetical protein NFI96_004867, partial [Prochilodus magdalenae]
MSRPFYQVPVYLIQPIRAVQRGRSEKQATSGVGLTRAQVEVLGNMTCTLDPTYIQNSDPVILEKLKNCGDLSDSQVTAVQTLLFSGSTRYGNTSTWTPDTLNQLGMLPLYLNQNFWGKFSAVRKAVYCRPVLGLSLCTLVLYLAPSRGRCPAAGALCNPVPVCLSKTTIKTFLKSFLPVLRKQNIEIGKLSRLFTASNSFTQKTGQSNVRERSPRAACTAGTITEAIIADPAFPVGYDSAQFDACLDNALLKDNPAAVCEKVIDSSFRLITLNKLKQLYPAGLPERVVKILNAVSREASVADINTWNITTVDTLSSLMNPKNGDWTSEKPCLNTRSLGGLGRGSCFSGAWFTCMTSKAVIMRYLSVPGNTLRSTEINAVRSYLCTLDVAVLGSITAESLRNSNPVNVSSCSADQKTALYSIAKSSFSTQRSDPTAYYQLISPYL